MVHGPDAWNGWDRRASRARWIWVIIIDTQTYTMCVENIIYIYMICRLYTIVHCMIWICIAFCYCSMICCSYNHMHPSSHPSVCPSIRPSIHPPTCTYTAVHYTAVHYTASCYIALHYITLHCVTLHCVAVLSQFYHIILHYIPWHCVACYMASPTHTQIVYICTYIYIYIHTTT